MEPTTTGGSRKQYSSEQKQRLLKEFKESGMGASEFSRVHGITVSAFGKWLSRERKRSGNPPGRPARKGRKSVGQAGFAELQITSSSPSASKTVLYAEVRSIKIYQPVSASYLKELQ